MTEGEWEACADPWRMLERLGGKPSKRKLRLLCCACSRRVWGFVKSRSSRKAVDVAERYADRLARDAERAEAFRKTGGVVRVGPYSPFNPARYAAARTRALGTTTRFCLVGCQGIRASEAAIRTGVYIAVLRFIQDIPLMSCVAAIRTGVYGSAASDEGAAQSSLFRCIFGNPFRPLTLDPAVLTSAVVSLAHAAYDERLLPSGELDPQRLWILADALEEAGAGDDALAHLRGGGPHVRGCFVVDACLGRA